MYGLVNFSLTQKYYGEVVGIVIAGEPYEGFISRLGFWENAERADKADNGNWAAGPHGFTQ